MSYLQEARKQILRRFCVDLRDIGEENVKRAEREGKSIEELLQWLKEKYCLLECE